MSVKAIYPEPAKEPIYLHNADHQSFAQPIEGVLFEGPRVLATHSIPYSEAYSMADQGTFF